MLRPLPIDGIAVLTLLLLLLLAAATAAISSFLI
jgi:hypothetical protein